MKAMKPLALAAALFISACIGEDGAPELSEEEAAPTAIELRDWVDSMVGSGESAEPDTVEDKLGIVIDTNDPTAFDELFQTGD
jgi:hypothetical protein